jgi:MFS family permease
LTAISLLIQIPKRLFRPTTPIPDEYRANFRNLFFDIAWYGVLNGSILTFISVYAARIGATGSQIGLLSAAPGIASLFFTLPVGGWLEKRPVREAVFLSSLLQRFCYVPLIFLPWIVSQQAQIWTAVILTLVISIPATVMVVGFNSMFADLVPPEWRGYVAGLRNALLAIVSMAINLVCGWLLVALPFPVGYQVVFGLGVAGALMSSVHLYWLARDNRQVGQPSSVWSWIKSIAMRQRDTVEGALKKASGLRLDIVRGPFGKFIFLLFFFHLVQYSAIPLFPLFAVNHLRFSDQIIGFQTATFSLSVFFGSSQIDKFSRRIGNHKLVGLGIIGMGSYPILTGLAKGIELYIIAAIFGGLAWAMVGGVLYNYIYEKIPDLDRAIYLSWYNLALNMAVLLGSLGGPMLANLADLSIVIIGLGLLRIVAGIAILIWG